jgi:hypothetical protein
VIKVLTNRFAELAEQLKNVEATKERKRSEHTGEYEHVDPELLLNWCVKARSLLSGACGKDSEHYSSFVQAEKPTPFGDNYGILKRVKAVFLAAREDFDGGYLISVRNLVQAEIAGSELEQARELLQSGYVSAAAVVAGVVLETTLRTLCDRHGIGHGKLDKMNADLAKAGQFNALVQKLITALAAIRNSAAHGKSGDFKPADVESMISEVEKLTLEFLS